MSQKKYNSIIFSVFLHLVALAFIYFFAFHPKDNDSATTNQPKAVITNPKTPANAPQMKDEDLEKMLPKPAQKQQPKTIVEPVTPKPTPPPATPPKPIVPVSKGTRVEKTTPTTNAPSSEISPPKKTIVPVTVGKRIEPPVPQKNTPSSPSPSIDDHISAKDAEMNRWLEGRERIPSTHSQESL